jgi:hypothetical protein
VDAQITPVPATVDDEPMPFVGSDNQTRLVYEHPLVNFTSGLTSIDRIEVLDADSGKVLKNMDPSGIAQAIQPFGGSAPTDDDVADSPALPGSTGAGVHGRRP